MVPQGETLVGVLWIPASQVVSELGQLGHREGEALSKIDSLGYQLAQLLDSNEPIVGLDVSSVWGRAGTPRLDSSR